MGKEGGLDEIAAQAGEANEEDCRHQNEGLFVGAGIIFELSLVALLHCKVLAALLHCPQTGVFSLSQLQGDHRKRRVQDGRSTDQKVP